MMGSNNTGNILCHKGCCFPSSYDNVNFICTLNNGAPSFLAKIFVTIADGMSLLLTITWLCKQQRKDRTVHVWIMLLNPSWETTNKTNKMLCERQMGSLVVLQTITWKQC